MLFRSDDRRLFIVKLEALNTLTAVIRHGSFAAASEFVHLTPSAVSLHIKQLEKYFGQPLFDRSARQARPTAFAHELASTVRRALGEIEAMRRPAQGTVSGRIRLGTIESIQMGALPAAFAALREAAPALTLHFVRGSTVSLLGDLKAGRIDVAVVVRPGDGVTLATAAALRLWSIRSLRPEVATAPTMPNPLRVVVPKCDNNFSWV